MMHMQAASSCHKVEKKKSAKGVWADERIG